MTEATSNYLNQPLRTEGQAMRRRRLNALRDLAARLDHQVALTVNGGFNTQAETQASRLRREAEAIRWALTQVDPEFEGPRQALEQIAGRPEG